MAVSRTLHRAIARGDFEAVETEWLEHLDEAPDDLGFFVGAARAVAGAGEEERTRLLLELLDDGLRERGLDRPRLGMLEGAGTLLLAPEEIHPEIVATLRRLWSDHSSFDGLADKVGLFRATHDLPKTWEKVARLEGLLQFEVGQVVQMAGKGVGRVTEINFALDSFRIDFERHQGLQVGFRAAAKLLRPLPEGHVLRRKLEQPEELAALVRDDPPELLRQVLVGAGRPLTAAEVKEQLSGIVGDKQWTAWWAAARRDPHVVTDRSGRQTYSWADSHDDAAEARWQTFATGAPREQIALLRRDGAADPELAARMVADLETAAAAAAADDPGLAFEIGSALERAGVDPGERPWAPELLVATAAQPGRLFAAIEDRALRERAYTTARERRDDWRQLFVERLDAEPDPRALDLLAETLAADPDERSARGYARFLDSLLARPHQAPAAFVWLAERAADDAALRDRNPLRLLQQILAGMGRDELAPFRPRLRKLLASGGTVPRLLPHLTEEQAPAAREAIDRAAGLESFEREALVTAIELRFPALRGERATQVLYATPESIDAKRAELDRLTRVELPANRKAIEEARAMGDLRENFEYKAARQRHEYLSSLAAGLHRDLERARPLELGRVDPSEARIGTRVRLRDGAGDERELTILGPWESDPDNGVISYQSELAAALLGKRPGDTVAAAGEPLTVVAIAPA